MPFRLHDHVRIRPGVTLEETGEPVPDWAGEIVETPRPGTNDTDVYLVELDAPSLGNIPPKFYAQLLAEEQPLIVYYFSPDDLEPAPRRDTPAERRAAQERLEDAIFPPEPEFDEDTLAEWIEAFRQSAPYAALPAATREEAPSIVEAFAQMAHEYEGCALGEWATSHVRAVAAQWMPQKLSADRAYFSYVAPALAAFFSFAGETGRIDNGPSLARAIGKAGPEIERNAADPGQWGPAKQMIMSALDAGVDMNDERALRAYLDSMIGQTLPAPPPPRPTAPRPAPADPWRHFSRNETIRVVYADGTVKEGKFKRLEADLRAGKCRLAE